MVNVMGMIGMNGITSMISITDKLSMQDTRHTVDTRDPAPVDIENLQCLLELHIISQVVQDIFHQRYDKYNQA